MQARVDCSTTVQAVVVVVVVVDNRVVVVVVVVAVTAQPYNGIQAGQQYLKLWEIQAQLAAILKGLPGVGDRKNQLVGFDIAGQRKGHEMFVCQMETTSQTLE